MPVAYGAYHASTSGENPVMKVVKAIESCRYAMIFEDVDSYDIDCSTDS
jgi:hypothetical protein